MYKITDIINKDTVANFTFYRQGNLYYEIKYLANNEELKFEFPIPISDTGTGTFPSKLKSITVMRWVRRHIAAIESGNDVY